MRTIWALFCRRRRDRELDEEIQAHLKMAAQDRIERGEQPQAAELAARREFGNRTLIGETTREMWGWNGLERLWQDTRYALRGMRRSPAFTAVTVLLLALAIGANTAIFSIIDMLLLRTLPVRAPAQLVEFLNQYPGDPALNVFSWRSYEHYRDHNHVFSAITGDRPSRLRLSGDGLEPELVNGDCVVGNFFQVLGIKPAEGRLIQGADDNLADPASAVAVLSWSYWKSRFNLDPAILGKRIVVENVPVTIIGVAPRDFFGLQFGFQPDVWIPFAVGRRIDPHGAASLGALRLIARLKPNVSIEQARSEMAGLFRWTLNERTGASKDPLMRQLRFTVEPAGSGLSTAVRDRFAKPLTALMAVAGFLLLLACTNVASMLLARGAARRREMAVRVSLGASRFRLVRQVLTESLLLSASGGMLGILLAYFGAAAIVLIVTSGRFVGPAPRIEMQALPDMHVLLFTAGAALLTGVLFGLAPAWNAFNSSPAFSLRDAGRAADTRLHRLFGKSLVAAQIALSVGLLSAAGLFIGNLSKLNHIDLGFQRDHVLLMSLDSAGSGYRREKLSRAYQGLLGRLQSIPGVQSATIAGGTPISGAGASRFVTVEGYVERPEDRRYVAVNWVAPKYFETLRTPLLAGRDFTLEDRGREPVAVVNEAMARYYFSHSEPIGKYITLDDDSRHYRIVGIVGNAKYYNVREPARRTIYLDTYQARQPGSELALRTNVNPRAVVDSVRRTIRELLPGVLVVRVTTLADQVDASIVPERLTAKLSGAFGVLGSLLAAIGMYGLLAYMAVRRVNEIGIRMALGATKNAIARMMFGEALKVTCIGLLIGVPTAYCATHFAAALISDLQVKGLFPIVFAAAAMMLIALIAAYLPAYRAASTDPMQALRHE